MDTENQSIVKSARRLKILVIVLVAILLLVVLFGGYWMFFKKTDTNPAKDYSVVYLISGEVYVGELSLFPRMSLSNVYMLQVAKDPKDSSKNTFNLTSLKESLWSPSKIYLNREQVIFYGKVGEDSKIAETLKQV